MNSKMMLYLGLAAVVLAAVLYYAKVTLTPTSPAEPTNTEAVQEIQESETSDEAAETAVEKIDAELTQSSETDFNAEDLSDQALEL